MLKSKSRFQTENGVGNRVPVEACVDVFPDQGGVLSQLVLRLCGEQLALRFILIVNRQQVVIEVVGALP